MIKPNERRAWIKQYIANNSAGVDILFGDFVDAYIAYVGARYRPTCWGAYKCKTLGKDLSDMAKRGELKRGRIGLGNNWQPGFPKWVWSYRLPDKPTNAQHQEKVRND